MTMNFAKELAPMSRLTYRHTIAASYLGYITQAIVNNLAPLLFVTFMSEFSLTLEQITMMTTVNFAVQLLVDLLSAKIVDRIGYRVSIVAAHVLAVLGLSGMAILPGILPPLTREEAVETTKIYSIAGQMPAGRGLVTARPFRSPHHSASAVSLAGGGAQFRPGECSLANCGVLFLDELPEFSRESLEVLRQPLEDGQITVSRAAGSATYPSRFQLVAAMNPCKCGYYGHPTRPCTCSPSAVRQYRSRVSGPLLDRIDLCVEMDPVAFDELHTSTPAESSADLRKQVLAARAVQARRYAAPGYEGVRCNAQLTAGQVRRVCRMTPAAERLLRASYDTLGLSARAHDRILRVARTVADLAGKQLLDEEALLEALQYRAQEKVETF